MLSRAPCCLMTSPRHLKRFDMDYNAPFCRVLCFEYLHSIKQEYAWSNLLAFLRWYCQSLGGSSSHDSMTSDTVNKKLCCTMYHNFVQWKTTSIMFVSFLFLLLMGPCRPVCRAKISICHMHNLLRTGFQNLIIFSICHPWILHIPLPWKLLNNFCGVTMTWTLYVFFY